MDAPSSAPPASRARGTVRHWALAVFSAVGFFALTVPGLGPGWIEPRILGLPFSLAWVVLWVVLGFAALLAFHLADDGERSS